MIFIFPPFRFFGLWFFGKLVYPSSTNPPKKPPKKQKKTRQPPPWHRKLRSATNLFNGVFWEPPEEKQYGDSLDGDLEGFVSRGTNLEAGYINLSQVERWWKWFFFGINLYRRFLFPFANGISVFSWFLQLFFFLVVVVVGDIPETLVWPAMAFPHLWPATRIFSRLSRLALPQNRNTLGKPTQHFCNCLEAKKEPWMMYICINPPYKEIGITYPRPPTLKWFLKRISSSNMM